MLRSLCAAFVLINSVSAAELPKVEVLRTPDSGLQPQVIVDDAGTIHLLTFQGEPGAGDLFYRTKTSNSDGFSQPIRVNNEPGSAIAIGTIRGGQMAIGKNGRIHVAWNGSDKAKPRNALGSTPMLYARSNAVHTGFEPQRNVMKKTSALDGGGSIAADRLGNVYVAWHARTEESAEGEAGRQLFVAKSSDDGATFSHEAPALDGQTGACACCGTKSLADSDGNLYILFRAAGEKVNRDLVLARSDGGGNRLTASSIHPWKIAACPMSSESIAESRGKVLAAWETAGRVYFARIDRDAAKKPTPVAPEGGSNRKHPSIAINAHGEVLLAWAEGTGWQRGGSLCWQLFDKNGKPLGDIKRVENGIPVWSFPSAAARPDGSFLIIH